MQYSEFEFSGRRPHEKVSAVVKNHPFVLLWPGLKAVSLWAFAVAIALVWPSQYVSLAAFLAFVIGLGIFSRSYFTYSRSSFIATSERVINISQKGFWGRKITETEIKNIQDVSSRTEGMFRTMLKFGDLVIRTSGAAQGSEIIVEDIPNPYEVQQLIANTK